MIMEIHINIIMEVRIIDTSNWLRTVNIYWARISNVAAVSMLSSDLRNFAGDRWIPRTKGQ